MLVPVFSSNWKQSVQVEVENLEQEQYDAIQQLVQQGLTAGMPNYRVIAQAFEYALTACPRANPSDLWRHVVYPAYLREMGDQSWKRASGDAFEEMFADIYSPRLSPYGVRIVRIGKAAAPLIIGRLGIAGKVAPSKIDIAMQGVCDDGSWHTFGIVHAKTSIAERIQDDAPASHAIINQGFISILATLDVKAFPPPHGDGINRGELGTGRVQGREMPKRNYVESAGDFTNLYSFNLRSPESPTVTASGCRIKTLSFSERQPDALVQDMISWWDTLKERVCTQNTVIPEQLLISKD